MHTFAFGKFIENYRCTLYDGSKNEILGKKIMTNISNLMNRFSMLFFYKRKNSFASRLHKK